MHGKDLTRVALICSIIGIVALFFVVQFIEPQKIEVKNAENYVGQTVILTGRITEARVNSTAFLKLEQNGYEITSVIFPRELRSINLTSIRNKTVSVEGKLSVYKGDMEIIVKSLDIL